MKRIVSFAGITALVAVAVLSLLHEASGSGTKQPTVLVYKTTFISPEHRAMAVSTKDPLLAAAVFKVGAFVGDGAYRVRATRSAMNRAVAKGMVRSATIITAAEKLHTVRSQLHVDSDPQLHHSHHDNRLRRVHKQAHERDAEPKTFSLYVVIDKDAYASEQEKRDMIAQWNHTLHDENIDVNLASATKISIRCSNGRESCMRVASHVAESDAVLRIERKPEYKLHDRSARPLVISGTSPPPIVPGDSVPTASTTWFDTTLYSRGITGAGQFVGVIDTGVDWNNCYFFDEQPFEYLPDNTFTLTSRKIASYIREDRSKCIGSSPPAGLYCGDLLDGQGHGTHVAGSTSGRAISGHSATLDDYNGVAPDAKLIFTDFGLPNGALYPTDDVGDMFVTQRASGARIISNSWGAGDFSPVYSEQSLEVDKFSWENLDTLVLFAAGNDGSTHTTVAADPNWSATGSIGSPGTAKNCLTVGASQNTNQGGIENANVADVNRILCDMSGLTALTNPALPACCSTRSCSRTTCQGFNSANCNDNLNQFTTYALQTEDVAFFSSRGPVKWNNAYQNKWFGIDVVAPGHTIGSANSNLVSSETPYADCTVPPTLDGDPYDRAGTALMTMSGTSMATPIVAGVAVLIRDYFVRGFYPTGGANAPADAMLNPSGALLKAAIVNGAKPMTGNYRDGGYDSGTITSIPSLPDSTLENNVNNVAGFGRVQADNSLFFNDLVGSKQLWVHDASPTTSPLTVAGAFYEHTIFGVDGTFDLSITLVWTDAPAVSTGQTGTSAIVNSLHLTTEVTAVARSPAPPALAPVVGHHFGVNGLPVGTPDVHNVVQRTLVKAVTSGGPYRYDIKIRIDASALNDLGSYAAQPFAVVVSGFWSGVTVYTPPPPVPTQTGAGTTTGTAPAPATTTTVAAPATTAAVVATTTADPTYPITSPRGIDITSMTPGEDIELHNPARTDSLFGIDCVAGRSGGIDHCVSTVTVFTKKKASLLADVSDAYLLGPGTNTSLDYLSVQFKEGQTKLKVAVGPASALCGPFTVLRGGNTDPTATFAEWVAWTVTVDLAITNSHITGVNAFHASLNGVLTPSPCVVTGVFPPSHQMPEDLSVMHSVGSGAGGTNRFPGEVSLFNVRQKIEPIVTTRGVTAMHVEQMQPTIVPTPEHAILLPFASGAVSNSTANPPGYHACGVMPPSYAASTTSVPTVLNVGTGGFTAAVATTTAATTAATPALTPPPPVAVPCHNNDDDHCNTCILAIFVLCFIIVSLCCVLGVWALLYCKRKRCCCSDLRNGEHHNDCECSCRQSSDANDAEIGSSSSFDIRADNVAFLAPQRRANGRQKQSQFSTAALLRKGTSVSNV